MKTGRNLQEVLVELNRQNKAKQDFISPAQGMRLREDGRTFELNHLTTDRQMTFGTTSLFHRQVASALGIPAKYYDLMQSQKPELLAENVNAWFADRTSSYMVRSMDYGSGQVARALLSERYRRIDNMEIATSVLPLFAGNDQYEVMSCEVTENRLYLKVVNHRLEMEVRKGDIVQAGVMISNSEVGLGAVSIQPLVYRLVSESCDEKQEVQTLEYKTKTEMACALLKQYLVKGDMASKEIYERLGEAGISRRTIAETKRVLGIQSYRKMRQWYWTLRE